MTAVRIENLGRTYKSANKDAEVWALKDLSMTIEPGEVRGLLGPNGAGKTTLVKILSTILTPSSGTALVHGYNVVEDAHKVRELIAIVLGGDRGLYWNLTGRQNLAYWCALYNVPSRRAPAWVDELLGRVDLLDRADDLVGTYSRGMKQRLHLARGMVGNPKVLFLDEPTIGLDPIAARQFRQLVKALQSEGKTIFLTTHDMAEAESICDTVALIDKGKLLAVETPATLSKLLSKYERIEFESPNADLQRILTALPGVESVLALPQDRTYRVNVSDSSAMLKVLEVLVGSGVTTIRSARPTLEEVYLQLMGGRSGK